MFDPALEISTYSSEADAPPVTTSATTKPAEGGHETAAETSPGGSAAANDADEIRNETSRAKTPRGTGIRHLGRPLRRG
jgi:hypothetical protein